MAIEGEGYLFNQDDYRKDKYVVFKKSEWEQWRKWVFEHANSVGPPVPIFDAVVIRRQDLFAAPALWSYAHAIYLAVKMLEDNGIDASGLKSIADYFSEQATLASEEGFKVPD